MSRYIGQSQFKHGRSTKIGVLLCNLGTPAAPTAAAVRRYLAEFLTDPRVIELPMVIWRVILHGIILRIRPKRSAEAYAKIWREDGSPLLAISQQQRSGIEERLQTAFPGRVEVALGMRYGTPSIADAMATLEAANVRRLLVVPLYPQYAAATTASVSDAVAAVFRGMRWVPSYRFIADYHDHPGYIEALRQSIDDHWSQQGRGEHLVMSFHGVPRETFLAGDPYHCQCHATARLLAESLAIEPDAYSISFQSRFGPKEWLQPYTDHTLTTLAANGVRSVDVVCPGFAADCLETLEEIAMQYAETFRDAGGESLNYIPALNDNTAHLDFLTDFVCDHLAGWPETEPTYDAIAHAEAQATAAARAEALDKR